MSQSFIVSARKYSCRADVRLDSNGEPEVVKMGEFYHHRPGMGAAQVNSYILPLEAIEALETAAIKAFWELGDPHDDTAIDRAEYRQGDR